MAKTIGELRRMTIPQLDAEVARLEQELRNAKDVRVQVAHILVDRAKEILSEPGAENVTKIDPYW